jgi:hypothetical protein
VVGSADLDPGSVQVTTVLPSAASVMVSWPSIIVAR